MIRNFHHKRASSGFSLLEVLIAVVLLATGLLALAALQGSLARNSSDAKARSRVIALLSAEMDTLRSATPYANVASAGPVTATNPDCSAPANEVERAACEAGLSSLSISRTVTQYGANAASTTFVEGAAPAGSSTAEFKNVLVSATWSDANGQQHQVSMRSAFSSLSLDVNSPIVDEATSNFIPQGAIVRQSSPVTAGMIPIALGNGDSTAASNPTPELVGKNQNQTLVGTRFNVLTYTPSNSMAVIQKRIETEVIKCTCEYGAGGTNLGAIYQKSQWPAVWTGSRYDVHAPDNTSLAAPGQQYASGPKAGVTQSPLCQECCRDHHDDLSNTTDARFDPETTATSYIKYNDNAGTLTAAGTSAGTTYVDACRIVRVDGFWRTASDLYARQFGLLETESDASGAKAKTGLPTTLATSRYTTYVKDYLQQYDGTSALPPTGAQAKFDETARQLNDPAEVIVSTPSNSDRRYLHARGLYVDYLEKKARDALAQSLTDRRAKNQCLAGGSDLADCVLPFLPFTTINLTEIAKWGRTDGNILNVNSDGALATDPNQPFGGRTLGVQLGIADTTSKIRHSNSGVAVSTVITGAVDLKGDTRELTDKQTFNVGGTVTRNGDDFYVNINGGPANYVLWYILGADTSDCQGSVHLRQCSTNTTLPKAGDLRLESYSGEESVSTNISSISGWTCKYKNGTVTVSDTTVMRPLFHNYQISSISNGGSVTNVANDGKTTETSTISFPSITTSMDTYNPILITLTDQVTPLPATFASCTALEINDKGNKTYWVEKVTWNKPWTVP